MYAPSPFGSTDIALAKTLVAQFPLATFLTPADGNIITTHIPIIWSDDPGQLGTIVGHLSTANDHWRHWDGVTESTFVICSPSSYISGGSYRLSQAAPTWNYAAVHIKATPRLVESTSETQQILRDTVDHFEQANGSEWDYESSFPYWDRIVAGVRAFTAEVTDVQAIQRLSQNKDAELRDRVLAQLDQSPSPEDATVSRLMRDLDGGQPA